ncbi:MAG: 4-alpha-glucanotransferase [Gammaproteobacteria bacterium]|nr:4-alpha-glucanotransferase [Gammaproteobacteria bacterium]
MSAWIDRRRSGVLLHISSLPGPFARGVLGEEARVFIDSIAAAGFTVWQFLPLGPTHGHGSPYESLSSAAGNPEFLDLRDCVSHGWLSEKTCQALIHGDIKVEMALAEASDGFWQQAEDNLVLAEDVEAFLAQNVDWLDDYALFAALKIETNNAPWWAWPAPLRDRSSDALAVARADHSVSIRQIQFQQFLFARQWQQLKAYAEQRGLLLFGDIPIYVAHDSVDVWSNRQYFSLNAEGLCHQVAGVPPDYFSESGQRWGNPLYNWDALQTDKFSWWVKRVRRQLARMHMVRIDHFRGLESYWAIPGESPDGRLGEWLLAPGAGLLETLQQALGSLPLIAEDLGLITPEVNQLRQDFNLPGMKILQFAFGDDDGNPYLPHHHELNSVVYTGTHDNDTSLGWWHAATDHEKSCFKTCLNIEKDDDATVLQAMVCAALDSIAQLAIIPAQDLIGLATEARFNIPGTLDNNWSWRLHDFAALQQVEEKFRLLNENYGRCASL